MPKRPSKSPYARDRPNVVDPVFPNDQLQEVVRLVVPQVVEALRPNLQVPQSQPGPSASPQPGPSSQPNPGVGSQDVSPVVFGPPPPMSAEASLLSGSPEAAELGMTQSIHNELGALVLPATKQKLLKGSLSS